MRFVLIALSVGCAATPAARPDTTVAAGGIVEPVAPEPNRPVRNIHLYIHDGEWEFADGKKTYIVSYVAWNDRFEPAPPGAQLPSPTIPAPTIRVKIGDEVHVFLHNPGHPHLQHGSAFSNVTHTIHFHGLDLVQAMDGVPGVPSEGLPERFLAGVAVGDTYEYKFVAEHEGTYSYHCHVDSTSHILLGMYGAFIVEGQEPNTIYGKHYDREYVLFYSEMDTRHNEAIRGIGEFDLSKWKSDYFLLNGRIFTADLKNPLSTIADPKTVIKAKEGETVLLRFLAMGYSRDFVFHPHAYHMQVIGTDGRALPAPYWKDTLSVASGERYEVLVPVIGKRNKVCLSCGLGKGISVAHDHNLGNMASTGKYPRGPLTIFVVE